MAARDLYEKDFYKILGVSKNAPADEIKKKYRSLARELHPDKNKGDVKLEDKFKAVSEAYDILGDEKKRAEYDEARTLYEKGGMRAPMGGGNFQGGDFGDIFGGGNPQDIFANLFGGGRRGPRKGQDLQTEATITLPVTFPEAALGADIKVPTLSGDVVTVRLAPGTSNGRVLRVKGRGVTKAGTTGDLLVTVEVQVPKRLEQKAEEALKNFASATQDEDVRAEFNSKANQ